MELLAAVSSTSNSSTLNIKTTPNRTRPPLLPSEPDHNYSNGFHVPASRAPKSREVTSRYLSTSSASSTTATKETNSKRPEVVTRVRSSPAIGRSQFSHSKAERMLIDSEAKTKTSRSISEAIPFRVSKAKKPPSTSPSAIGARRGTPERKRSATPKREGQPENSRPVVAEQHRWPGRSRRNPPPEVAISRRAGSSEANHDVIRELDKCLLLSTEIGPDKRVDDGIVRCKGLICSDGEGVSSGAGGGGRCGVRGIVVPARFWQETNGRLRREPGSPVSRMGLKGSPKKLGIESPGGVANRRGQLCPFRSGFVRPASVSPSNLGVGNYGVVGMVGGLTRDSNVNMPSILCCVGDIRRGKVSENRIVEVHLLRILYNRLLQWRFVNARAFSALSIQRLSAQKSLYNACITTSKLHDSVRAKRSVLLQLRQNLKLISILKRQMLYLDELELIEQDYSRSLSGAIEALRASTLRLPVACGAMANVQNVKDAISSAVDVLQAMASSTRLLLAKVAEAHSLVSELANVIKKEGALLNHCKDLLSILSSMKVKEYSLRTHILQLKRAPMELKTEA